MQPKVIFASDIDNTLTDERHIIPDRVIEELRRRQESGWQLFFLTGRAFSFAIQSTQAFQIPYLLGVQNGAEVLEMPERKVISRHFLLKEILHDLEEAFCGHSVGFIIYSGLDEGDFCYYEPKKFSNDMLAYFEKLQALSSIAWKPIHSTKEIVASGFPLIKGFGSRKELQKIRDKLLALKAVQASVITDSVDANKAILLITAQGVDKGSILRKIVQEKGWRAPIIAAGDDENDVSLLQQGDIAICVNGGSEELKSIADYVTPPSRQLGILQALSAIDRKEKS